MSSQVLTYDNRGTGRSITAIPDDAPHSTSMSANDALALIRHVWGDCEFHLYGASMGGMVAQEMACKVLRSGQGTDGLRLKSIMLAVTSRSVNGSFMNLRVRGGLQYRMPLWCPSKRS